LAFFGIVAWVAGSFALTGEFTVDRYTVEVLGSLRLGTAVLAVVGVLGILASLRWLWNRHVLGHGITPDGVLRDRSGRPVR
jgi:hypothetical protein